MPQMRKAASDPIAQLMQEHDETLRQLKKLSKVSTLLVEKGYSQESFTAILSSLRFIHEEVNHHNSKEEEALFPVLERYVEGPTQLMRKDHQDLYRLFKRLQEDVNKVKKNTNNKQAVRTLAETCKSVVQVFVNHIHKENYVLFPLVQKFLRKEELREIAKKMI